MQRDSRRPFTPTEVVEQLRDCASAAQRARVLEPSRERILETRAPLNA